MYGRQLQKVDTGKPPKKITRDAKLVGATHFPMLPILNQP